jgi:hypothetical protein
MRHGPSGGQGGGRRGVSVNPMVMEAWRRTRRASGRMGGGGNDSSQALGLSGGHTLKKKNSTDGQH